MSKSRSGVKTVAIVGGGIAGLSLAWALGRRGLAVDLFEQGPLPNPISSSYDEHRINRHAYGRLTGYARMMPDAYRIWDRLWADLGARHYEETGGLYVLRQDDDWFLNTSASLAQMGISFRDVANAEIEDRFPMLETDGVLRAVEVGGSGLLFPVNILTALTGHLPSLGVRLHAGTRIDAVDTENGRVTIGNRVHEADVVVVAAGAWVNRLLPDLIGEVVPSRQAVIYLAPPEQLAAAWASAPVIVVRDVDGSYTLPPRRGMRLKIGDHSFSRTGDPDDGRIAGDADLAALWRGLKRSYRHMEAYRVLEPKACYYTVTDDESFRVRPVGLRGWVISACSGHGFKLGPLIAEGVARAVVGDCSFEEIPEWAAGRGSAMPGGAL